ncbi:MAG: hypothetical protein GXO35_02610 [Gammaproteobacteria bacterium]|nr:hypothetical protein [Gammaproteobacteria bacterium]
MIKQMNTRLTGLRRLACVILLASVSVTAQADWLGDSWGEAKSLGSSLWEDTKSVSGEVWEDTKAVSASSWASVKEEAGSGENSMSDIAKLADKETYVNAWEGIKESATHPSAAEVDSAGIPTQED